MPLLARALAQKAPGPAPRGVEAAVPSGGADVQTWLGKTAAEVGQMLVGCSISKLFPKYGYFKGEVESFDAQTGMFAVVYEDNDEDMMTLAQLAHCLPKAQEKLAREYLEMVESAARLSLPDMYEEMPVPSNDLQMPIKELDVLLSVYGTLRSFSFLFRLSPFPLRTLCVELNKARMSSLIDEVRGAFVAVSLGQ